ncbi:MAG TPA: hypothetical protein VNJ54_12710 [Plantibacter sp.]|uniref:hypothetical protein n=1 Tax=Plantibacter sp. TaxID=1871045 RepID=UPI002C4202C0|nr:hypothetical protein [Plantibacter sp.]
MPVRRLASLVCSLFVALCVVSVAGAAVETSASLRFGFVPGKTFRGTPASITVVVRPLRARCTAAVVYADGFRQAFRPVVAKAGRAAWKWVVPADAQLGAASVTVACAGAGRVSRTFSVVGPPQEPARIDVANQGFSQRVKFGRREVSYGVVLANPSKDKDALTVSVQVNFLGSTDTVLKTETTSVAAVAAKTEFNLGGSVSIPEGIPVSKLEIVTRLGGQDLAAIRQPVVSDIRLLPDFDPGYVGTALFQVLNDSTTSAFVSPKISMVMFDSSGAVLGGGTGFSTTQLMPGVRAQFDAKQGLSAIPIDRVAVTKVSILGRYQRVT